MRRSLSVASVVPEPGARAQGLRYRITSPELSKLDQFEGASFADGRISKLVTDQTGRRRPVQVYRQSADNFEPRLPQPDYFGVLLRAYGRLGFDVAPLATAVGVKP